eukprot:COSAG01_NODE_1483_length_10158_cov_38.218290_1_plen_137_part_10
MIVPVPVYSYPVLQYWPKGSLDCTGTYSCILPRYRGTGTKGNCTGMYVSVLVSQIHGSFVLKYSQYCTCPTTVSYLTKSLVVQLPSYGITQVVSCSSRDVNIHNYRTPLLRRLRRCPLVINDGRHQSDQPAGIPTQS